ncbi:protein FAM110C [Trichomycterus rosablanca]|uniref:protein FAM110C n=1 Tax=Trichomycterus rosablanca TaxID=2290929 RepID=UPI002F359AAD
MLGTSRILEKGPEYLRKQMEREREATGRVSAAERLAATKINYVRSPQVSSPSRSEPASSKTADGNAENEQEQVTEGNIVKRNSSKKRPDSILLYRQKCELQRGSGNTVRRTFLSSLKEKSRGTKSENKMQLVQIRVFDEDGADTGADEDDPPRIDFEGGLEPERARKAVGRSHSDISSRYSKNFGDFDAFFTYCGLEENVVQSLGRENFSSRSDELNLSYAKIRSVSVATSDGEHSHTSGDIDGLHEEEVKETRQQGSSVIERNARVIKWLYSCKNASQSGKTLRDLD